MSTQKHTPGPWRLETDYPNGFLILKDEPHPSHDPVWTVANVNACMGAESKSNARLIAAAPDLLAALKLAATTKEPDDKIERMIWMGRQKIILAAIAKAEGNA